MRIVAIGDSTTAGTPGFLSPLEAPPAGRGDVTSQYAWWLMRARPGWDVLNRGVNGERSDQIRARFARDVLDVEPQIVVVIAGVNDVYQGRSSDQVIEELRAIYASAGEAGIPIVAGSIIPFNTATADQNARMREINGWIDAFASRVANIAFADTRRAVAARNNPDLLASTRDELHPSPEGYRLMAEALLPAIDGLLRAGGQSP